MTLEKSLAWLNGTQQFGIKLGLENTRRLLEAAGRPDQELKIIHVAGTNGKGSTCAMIDAYGPPAIGSDSTRPLTWSTSGSASVSTEK